MSEPADSPNPTDATTLPEPAVVRAARISTATLILGVSGAGKTSLLETFATYLWETHQQVLLLYSWDGGAIPTNIQKRIHQGLIRFWRARTRSANGLALETLALASKGYWPKQINPRTGETASAVDLVSPISARYAMTCPAGHQFKTVPLASMVLASHCLMCVKMIPVHEMTVTESVGRTKGFELVGGVAFDGITSMAQVVLEDMDRMRGHGFIGGEKSSFGGTIVSGGTKYGGNNRADVGFAQTRAQQWVGNSLTIPFLKESPVFTGLSTEGSDQGGLSVVGVNLPGQAALTQAPQWFGNIVEADNRVDDAGKKHYVLRVRPYTDPQGRKHLLKTAASPIGPVPDQLEDPAVDEKRPFEQFNLGLLFRLLDQDLAESLTEVLVGAPGVPDGLVEYGEPLSVEGVSAPSAAGAGPGTHPNQAGRAGTGGAPQGPQAKPGAPRPAARPTAGRPAAAPPVAGAAAPTASTPPPPGMKPPARAPGT